jgi:hypothetical protein
VSQEQTQTLPIVSAAAIAYPDNLAQHTEADRTHDAACMHDQVDAAAAAAAAAAAGDVCGDVCDDVSSLTPATFQGTQEQATSQQVYDAVYTAVYEKSTHYLLGTLSSPRHHGCKTAGNCPTQTCQDAASEMPCACPNSQVSAACPLAQQHVVPDVKLIPICQLLVVET